MALERDVIDGYPVGPTYGDSIRTTIAVHLLRNFGKRSLVIPELRDGFTKGTQARIRDYIHANLHRAVKLDELAKLARMDSFRFQRAFKESFKLPPHRYILRARMEHAISLMRKTSRPLVDISMECGFSSQSHMTTMCRRVTGRSPTSYRASGPARASS